MLNRVARAVERRVGSWTAELNVGESAHDALRRFLWGSSLAELDWRNGSLFSLSSGICGKWTVIVMATRGVLRGPTGMTGFKRGELGSIKRQLLSDSVEIR